MAETDPIRLDPRTEDLTERDIYDWFVIRFDKYNRGAYWLCRCKCGTERSVRGSALTNGQSRSCGCAAPAAISACHTTHGMSKTQEFSIWVGLVQRATKQTHKDFPRWGGRGITVCERWQGPNGFANFLADMGPRPSKQHSVERKDNEKGYDPDNCEWATAIEQGNNRRTNVFLTMDGKKMTIKQWARATGIGITTLDYRLKHGWTVKQALTTPARKHTRKKAG